MLNLHWQALVGINTHVLKLTLEVLKLTLEATYVKMG